MKYTKKEYKEILSWYEKLDKFELAYAIGYSRKVFPDAKTKKEKKQNLVLLYRTLKETDYFTVNPFDNK